MNSPSLFDGHDVGVAATRFHRVMRQNVTAALAPFGMTGAEYGALHYAARNDAPSNSDLARYLLITPQALGRLTSRLEMRGLLTRTRSPQTHRHAIRLTAAGEQALNAARASVEASQQKLLAPLDEHERTQFVQALIACASQNDTDESQNR